MALAETLSQSSIADDFVAIAQHPFPTRNGPFWCPVAQRSDTANGQYKTVKAVPENSREAMRRKPEGSAPT